MPLHHQDTLPSTRRLLLATVSALAAASAILVAAVLPAEYGIDPTGIGRRLGLLTLASTAQAAVVPKTEAAQPVQPAPVDQDSAALAAQAAAVFGAQAGQSFDARAVVAHASPPQTETLTLTLPPGKGVEAKALMNAGDAFIFRWTASADVAVDMHGERPEVKDEYTSYAIAAAQREGAGHFVAPFGGQHGWYWLNRGSKPVTVQVSVTGSQRKLFRPGHP